MISIVKLDLLQLTYSGFNTDNSFASLTEVQGPTAILTDSQRHPTQSRDLPQCVWTMYHFRVEKDHGWYQR